jgi:hypothetical protein
MTKLSTEDVLTCAEVCAVARDKTYSHSLKVSLSDFEVALLEHLQPATRNPLAEEIRLAIFFHASRHPGFDAKRFLAEARQRAAKIENPEARRSFEARVSTFLQMRGKPVADTGDADAPTAVPPINAFGSSPSHFNEDD